MFRVGQKVVCVDDGLHGLFNPPGYIIRPSLDGLAAGRVYTVRWLGNKFGRPTVWLAEITRPIDPDGIEAGYAVERFRPAVDRPTDINIFTEILDKAGKVVEPA